MRLLFVYKDFLGKGGFPNEIRTLVLNFSKSIDIDIICRKEITELEQKNIKFIFIENLKEALLYKNQILYNKVIFCGYSSMYNVILSFKIKQEYIVLPFSQINTFLDFDNPFEKNSLPIISNLENGLKSKNFKISRVKNGHKDIFSYFRSLKRKLYRVTFGKYFLNKSSAIGIISNYEQKCINNIYKKNTFNFFYYRFGSFIDTSKKGIDTLPKQKDIVKLVIWSRVDFYYKGIDRILYAIKELNDSKIKINFKLYIIGPDYNNGYEQINEYTKYNNIQDYINIIKPGQYTSGTYGMLSEADISVCLSRWDGYPRVLRESFLLNIPLLVSEEANFDKTIKKFNSGIIIKNNNELIKYLSKINFDYINNVKIHNDLDYLSWENVSDDFIYQIKHTGEFFVEDK